MSAAEMVQSTWKEALGKTQDEKDQVFKWSQTLNQFKFDNNKQQAIDAKKSNIERLDLPHITRYFDLIQNIIHNQFALDKDSVSMRYIDIQTTAPQEPRVVEEKRGVKKGEEVKKIDQTLVHNGIEPVNTDNVKVSDKVSKETNSNNDKKESKKKGQKVKETSVDIVKVVETAIGPGRIDLRVGRIVSAEKHPQADSLYVELIDVGEQVPRQVVSGLVKHYTLDNFIGKSIVVVCNLKPAKMRGIESSAMVLCASVDERVELVEPPRGSVPGDKIWFEGFEGTPDIQLKSKEKVWETQQSFFATSEKFEPCYVDVDGKVSLLRGDKGLCLCPSIAKGTMK